MRGKVDIVITGSYSHIRRAGREKGKRERRKEQQVQGNDLWWETAGVAQGNEYQKLTSGSGEGGEEAGRAQCREEGGRGK